MQLFAALLPASFDDIATMLKRTRRLPCLRRPSLALPQASIVSCAIAVGRGLTTAFVARLQARAPEAIPEWTGFELVSEALCLGALGRRNGEATRQMRDDRP